MSNRIIDYINLQCVDSQKEYLRRSRELGFPNIVVEQAEHVLNKMIREGVQIKGDQTLLIREFNSVSRKIGRGGKEYLHFKTNDGDVAYFPKARYGRFISSISDDEQ